VPARVKEQAFHEISMLVQVPVREDMETVAHAIGEVRREDVDRVFCFLLLRDHFREQFCVFYHISIFFENTPVIMFCDLQDLGTVWSYGFVFV
jgi:hypothetical protein